ncbi:rRNA pseudouridine synthase [Candidatus Cytomitobacter indipagum]|uniref:Dual-specificity RNA pseudouridine synthase RluF n=1 Tax=Candidatus Cytomitobacter indipagum TaxID=2601575 RepID=A0A5C0UD73_9PROT|nr:S4 domain-containing protein [Candidatus Cytomitobacter indipagum]QEK37928.1 rRNA pseudouridine synthase [Candidatus Cytomitobacter indipagum]
MSNLNNLDQDNLQNNANANELSKNDDKKKIGHAISSMGFCSRREAERLVQYGRVCVNGIRINECAERVSNSDEITVDGRQIKKSSKVFIFHKPIKYLTTHNPQDGYETIFDIINIREHLTFLGRLDYMSEGLVVLTNVPSLVKIFSSSNYKRVYDIYVNHIDRSFASEIRNPCLDGQELMRINMTNQTKLVGCYKIRLELREGKNREIRRICEKCNMTIFKLKKVQHGPFKLGNLSPGEIQEINFSKVSDYISNNHKSNKS